MVSRPSATKAATTSSIIRPVVAKLIILAALGVLGSLGLTIYDLIRFWSTSHSPPTTPVASSVTTIPKVTALGRLEPRGEAIQLSAFTANEAGRVEQLLVKQGDTVRTGQVVAILDSRARLEAALEQAREQVQVSESNLEQVKAGAKSGEINAQAATISRIQAERRGQIAAQAATVARLEAESRNAQLEYQRYEALFQNGAISASARDSKLLTAETVQQQLLAARANLRQTKEAQLDEIKEAKATLNKIVEVRPVDVRAAQAQVKSAIAAVKEAQANLDLAFVRAPRDGQILKIHTWPGEVVGSDGVVTLGQTSQMYVVAEVYETDVGKVRLGQQATITSRVFPGELQGTVEQIGLEIGKRDVLDTDPTADIDARVVEVKIRLTSKASRVAAAFTNLQVRAVIDVGSSS